MTPARKAEMQIACCGSAHLFSTKLLVGISSKPIRVKILRNCDLTCTQGRPQGHVAASTAPA